MMMRSDLSPAKAGEERLGLVRASAFVAIGPFMIDALRQEARMQRIPMQSFVGMDGAARLDDAVEGFQ